MHLAIGSDAGIPARQTIPEHRPSGKVFLPFASALPLPVITPYKPYPHGPTLHKTLDRIHSMQKHIHLPAWFLGVHMKKRLTLQPPEV